MKLVFAEKKILLYTLFNFLVGCVMGTILFYAQLNAQGISTNTIQMDINTKIALVDVFRLAYLNALWLISIFIAHRIMPSRSFHPILIARGAVCAFSVSYIINFLGILQAAATIFPQCFSIIPAMLTFSHKIVQMRKNAIESGKEMFSIRRRDIFFTMLLAIVSAIVESILFMAFCRYLL